MRHGSNPCQLYSGSRRYIQMRTLLGLLFCLFVLAAHGKQASTPVSKIHHHVAPPKVKIHLPRSFLVIAGVAFDDNDDHDDSVDLQVAFGRPRLISNTQLSREDYINLRLANARRLALLEYRRVWSNIADQASQRR
jgi:hypothetical protein